MGKFVVKKQKDGQFKFDLKATNGQIILSSEGYTTKAACLNGIESVKKNAAVDARFETITGKSGKPHFVLKATNGQVVGTSEVYETAAACKNGIESVKKNAPDAAVEDTTA
jgi:uncharacterized protein YegP (UPF0339 family)